MPFPAPHDANFLMVCTSESTAASVYEPPPRHAPSSPSVSRTDCAGVSPCSPSVGQKSPRANVKHDWRLVSSAPCVPPFSHLRCRSASPSYDGLSPSEIWCTWATWARRPLPCSCLRQCLHRTFLNSRGLLFGFLAQWCLSCSLTPLAV